MLELSSDSKASLCCIAKQPHPQLCGLLISLSPISEVSCKSETPDLGKKAKKHKCCFRSLLPAFKGGLRVAASGMDQNSLLQSASFLPQRSVLEAFGIFRFQSEKERLIFLTKWRN